MRRSLSRFADFDFSCLTTSGRAALLISAAISGNASGAPTIARRIARPFTSIGMKHSLHLFHEFVEHGSHLAVLLFECRHAIVSQSASQRRSLLHLGFEQIHASILRLGFGLQTRNSLLVLLDALLPAGHQDVR